MCGKCFTQTLHLKTTTAKNQFRCKVCENSLRDNLYIKTHTQKRNHIVAKCVESVSHSPCIKKTTTGKNQFRCQVCENSLRDNLYIKTHTQKINHIIVKCVQSASQKVCMRYTKSCIIHSICERTSKILLI